MAHHRIETLAIHAGQEPDETTGAVVPPIYQVSNLRPNGVGGRRRSRDERTRSFMARVL